MKQPSPHLPRPRSKLGGGAPQAAYLRHLNAGGPAQVFSAMPSLRDPSDDVLMARNQAAARAVDAMHNNGWIAGVTDQMVALMIGEGLTPNVKPDMSAFGWDERKAGQWARQIEKRFRFWADNPYECDAGGRQAFGQIQAAAVRQWFGSGEIVAQLPMIKRHNMRWGTKVRLLPAHWLSERSDQTTKLEQGIFLDRHGASAGYLFNIRDQYSSREIKKAARDYYGRPIIMHIFDGNAGQLRGITPFAPILKVLRDYDQLSNATLTAAMIQAIFAATIESDYPTSEVLDALQSAEEQDERDASFGSENRFDLFMESKVNWMKQTSIDLGNHGKIAHLSPGEKLALNRSEHPNSTYEAFANFLLREIARCAGALFEDLTGDYRGATYSSIRMGIAKQWPLLMYRRRHIARPLCQGCYEAWLEEEIDSGAIPLPGGINAFLAHKAEICRVSWRGPAKPVADEVKAAKAHETYRGMGVITDDQIASDNGNDIEEVYDARAYEQAMRKERKIHGGLTNGASNVDEPENEKESAE